MSFETLYHGAPDQPQPKTYELASFGRRLAAFAIDWIVLQIIGGLIGLGIGLVIGASDSSAAAPSSTDATLTIASLFIGLIINIVYYWHFWTRRDGQTPGKAALDIQIIKTDGSRFTTRDFVARYLGYVISGLPLLLGYVWALFDGNNQTWHDKIAGTYVVRAHRKKQTVVVHTYNDPL